MTTSAAVLGTFLLSDPLVTGIPVVEDGSGLVDLEAVGVRVRRTAPSLPPGLGFAASAAGPQAALPVPPEAAPPARRKAAPPVAPGAAGQEEDGTHRLVRSTLADRLGEADALLPSGLRLLVVEGLRPLAIQRTIHAAYRSRLALARPGLDPAELDRLASRFVAPPATAPHVSGAAVDLTLVDEDGGSLDLGTSIDATPEESSGACYFDAPDITTAARLLRTTLAHALGRAGLVNYPTEWWHWSFGDRYWALVTGSPFAIHGPVAGR